MMKTVWWVKFSLACGCCPLPSGVSEGPSVGQPGWCIYTLAASPCSVPPRGQPNRLSSLLFEVVSVFCNPWFLQGPCIILSHSQKLNSVAFTLLPISSLFTRKLHEHLQSFSMFGCLLWPILTWVFRMNYDPVAICIVLTVQFLNKILLHFNSYWLYSMVFGSLFNYL